jgi:hypothetical protein
MGLLRVDWSKSTRTMADLLDEMAVRWPDDEGVINDDVYYHLLLRQHVPEMARQAETLVKNNPYSAAHLTTLALARLRQHDDEGALKVYEGSHIPWDTAAPSTVAVYAATLEANGRDRLAHRISASIPRDKLRPEEAALIRDLL